MTLSLILRLPQLDGKINNRARQGCLIAIRNHKIIAFSNRVEATKA